MTRRPTVQKVLIRTGKLFILMAALLIAVVIGAYWLSNTPTRPDRVAVDAVWLWAPFGPLPQLPRHGQWISCRETPAATNFVCTISDESARQTYQGVFVPAPGRKPRSPYVINAAQTRSVGTMIGDAQVPLVHLNDGSTLIPVEAYDRLLPLAR